MKQVFRSIQTLFPSFQDFRFRLKYAVIRLTKSPHEKDFNALTHFGIAPNDLILDIGSNRGEAIVSAQVLLGKNTQIVAFEPNPLVFKKLVGFDANPNVTLHNCGLGNKDASLELYVPFYRKWMFDGLSSFKKEEATDWLKTRLWNYKEKHLRIEKIISPIKRLDAFELQPSFIKIDVQGFELEVLKGGIETLKKHLPILLIEDINDALIDFLKPLGYHFYRFENGKFLEGKGTLNTFCISQEKFAALNL